MLGTPKCKLRSWDNRSKVPLAVLDRFVIQQQYCTCVDATTCYKCSVMLLVEYLLLGDLATTRSDVGHKALY